MNAFDICSTNIACLYPYPSEASFPSLPLSPFPPPFCLSLFSPHCLLYHPSSLPPFTTLSPTSALPSSPLPWGCFLPPSDFHAPELSVSKVECQLVMLMEKFPGKLEVTTKNINFVPDQQEVKESLCEYCYECHVSQ